MHFYNAAIDNFSKIAGNKKIVIWGVGEMLERFFSLLFTGQTKDNILFAVDKKKAGSVVEYDGKTIEIREQGELRKQSNCVVLIASTVYMSQIYEKIEDMDLDDSVIVMALGLMLVHSAGRTDDGIWDSVKSRSKSPLIPKVIHSFWFSNDPIPDDYKNCVDTWYRFCPDYDIKIWNLDTYDGSGSRFFEQAIAAQKWAFAADYSRLDVLNRYGGIYMDMDVELLRNLDVLLGLDSFVSFSCSNYVGLEVAGSVRNHHLMKELLSVYENTNFDAGNVSHYVQPIFIERIIRKYITMNGNMQEKDGILALPWNYLNTQDNYVFRTYTRCEDTIAIHRDNVGWCPSEKSDRIAKNRELEKKVETEELA